MKILGVHIGHDSGASLIVDGRMVADVAEERFTRIKHYSGLPFASIGYCLEQGGCAIGDIDVIAVPSKYPVPELQYLFELSGPQRETASVKGRTIEWAKRLSRIGHNAPPLYLKRLPLAKRTRIVHVEHHLAHAAAAYYTSGIDGRCLVTTVDGVGDGYSTCLWRAEAGRIVPLVKYRSAGSIGWFYSNVTEALGWWHGDGEGKTMGLAPYGDHRKTLGLLERFHPKFENGKLVESHDYGVPGSWNENGAYQWHLEESAGIKRLIDKHGPKDIAAEAQRVLEEQAMALIMPWLEREGTASLACAGGVFLNVKLNQRLWYTGKIRDHWTYPNPGDSGLSAGAALHAYHSADPSAPLRRMSDLYLGPEYAQSEIDDIISSRNLKCRATDAEAEAAELLARGKIVAWFQGRMEAGPRALGNRSILMSAARPENKDIINSRVKFREAFRPFCPSLLDERREQYLVKPREEPYMITSFDVVPDKRDRVPSVVHQDNTARPQTVTAASNPRYHRLIRNFGELTGEALLLNTSLNIKGEPIICHPREAIRCFFDSGIDALFLGDRVLEK